MTEEERRQQIFTRVVTALHKQGERSKVGPSCKYRLEKADGRVLRCAIGHLFTDDDLRDIEERTGYDMVLRNHPVFDSDMPKEVSEKIGLSQTSFNKAFLRQLQGVHDDYPPEYWLERFKTLGKNWHLSTSFIDELETSSNRGDTNG